MQSKSAYDFLLVGSGLFNAVFAYRATCQGKKCLVIDKRNHPGGNIYCENIEGINVHKYGAHIFHTSNKGVWDLVTSLVQFNPYINSPIANYKGKLYNLPFNMNTFYALWGITNPEEAKRKIEEQRQQADITNPANLEEQAISLVGRDIYEILIKEYTEKQWGKPCVELPAFIIRRLPVRFIFDNNYFNDRYQCIPVGGYNKLIEALLKGVEVKCNTDFFENKSYFENIAERIVFTGKIDEYYNYRFGELEYRSLHFETEILDCQNYQGNAVVNYTERDIPFTRIIEHKHFEFGQQPQTVITREYPQQWKPGMEPFYPVNTEDNQRRYQKYRELSLQEKNIFFGGRLGEYKYLDMDKTIESAISLYQRLN